MTQADVQVTRLQLEKERKQLLAAIHAATGEKRDKLVEDSIGLTRLIEALNKKRLN